MCKSELTEFVTELTEFAPKLSSGKATQLKTTHRNKTVCTNNSLRKLFLPVLAVYFKGKRGDSLHKLSQNCFRKLCFHLGGWLCWGGSPLHDPRERQRGGGQKSGGGKTSPHRKQFPTPLTSVRFAPPPPHPISLIKSLRNPHNFPQVTSSKTIFGGSPKMVSKGPSSRGFAFRYVLPPPP